MKLNFLSLGLTLMTTVLLGNVAVAANEAEIKKSENGIAKSRVISL